MEKPIEAIFLPQAERFVDRLDEKSRRKFFQAIRKTKERLIGQWFTKLKDSDGIYEFRIDESGKFYRLFAFWDTKGEKESLIVSTHGIAKKSNKTPKEAILKAEQIKKAYFKEKRLEEERKNRKKQ
ncbi:type II toxin-antitoxin system RelE/ParE family toxin [uncultured Acetobacteroides sp.]|uniref:type II toxin-antitoxin system RelE/ParE family toxin n=1 Tax=uncultured Acetobacteroides sp. TaxID=1760811 RepID=UPI0029F5816D|nr:type II toxin-antitoxin system RelE/ParE family toxin [uncultured Acetobacteroides sp.]